MSGGGTSEGGPLLPRERLLQVLRRRHRLRLILLDAPAGFGRTTLLRQAVAEGPLRRTDRDVVVTPSPAADLRLLDVLDPLAPGPDEHLAVIIDDAHRAVDARALPELVDRLPERVHLVVSTRAQQLPGLARMATMADVERLDGRDLAFTFDEVAQRAAHLGCSIDDPELATWPAVSALLSSGADDLVVPYLQTEVIEELEHRTARAISALAAVGGGGPALVQSILDAVGGDGTTRAELTALPLVTVAVDGTWPHPLWREATSDLLDGDLRTQAIEWAVADRLARRAPAEAGALALEGGHGEALGSVVRAALATQPPLVSGRALREWAESELLPADAPERIWLAGVVSGQAGLHSTAVGELERARSAFERLGDIRSEARVLLQLGAEARKRDDFDLLTRLVGRATQLTTDAGADLVGLRAIASAVTAQMGGDPDGAIASLEAVPERALTGDWGAQLHMILATNLALAGRDQDALASFERATGLGSTASQAVANDLFASTLWIAGRFDAALEAAGEAEALARRAEVPVTIDLTIAARACLLALAGDDDARSLLDGFDRRRATDGEALALAGVAHAVLAIHEGDLDGAAEVLAELPPPARRPTRSKLWRAALESSLGSEGEDRWRTAAAEDRSLRRAVEAASFARARLRDGTAVPARARPFLPACWWSPSHPRVHLRFLGGATVHRDRRATDVPAWQRGRVRELALHLATRRGVDRAAVAAALWPDLNAPSASRNLRVTLSHLLDVLDPERTRGQSSTAVVDAAGSLHLAEVDWLRVDVVELEGAAQDVLASAGIDDLSGALAACRRLLRFDEGPLLGGASAGEWLEPVRRRLDDLVLRAAEVGAQLALDIGENALAGELGRRMVVLDPWAERGHRLIIAAHLADGDFDAARRAVTETLRVLSALDVAPLPETLELAHRSGWQTVRRPHDLVAGQPPA